jgi:dTMP kinase
VRALERREQPRATLGRSWRAAFLTSTDTSPPPGAAGAREHARADATVGAGALVVFRGLDGSRPRRARLAAAARPRPDPRTARPYEAAAEDEDPRDGALGERCRRGGLRWFVEQRREHVRERVAPALAAGQVVLCDRYFLSTAAYQGARGLDAEAILAAGEREFPLPRLVLLLELDAALALARVASRGGPGEPVFERREFLERVAANFRRLARPYVATIDAARSEAEVEADVARAVQERTGLLA